MNNTSTKSVYVAGHRGMVGSAIVENLKSNGYQNVFGISSSELDLRNQQSVNNYISEKKPDIIIIAAARVGGILANDSYPWQFLYDNLMIQANLVNAAHENNIQDLVFLGSSCIYPKFAPQPLKEEYLLTDALEPTNEWYAIAKITGIKLCQALNKQYGRRYISLMPTNLYGPRDNFDLKTSHVLPAMIRKFHEAKEQGHIPVPLWGTGSPMREFLHVDDLAEAVRFILEYSDILEHDLFNVGTGVDLTIKDLAELVKMITGHNGEIQWDASKPDGTPRKLMDNSRLRSLGWRPSIELEHGVGETYRWYTEHSNNVKQVQI